MAQDKRTDTQALIIGLNHPIRRTILRAMPEGEEISPTALAALLKMPLPTVSYHVRALVESGAIVLTREEQVRGTMRHYYRSAVTARWALELLAVEE